MQNQRFTNYEIVIDEKSFLGGEVIPIEALEGHAEYSVVTDRRLVERLGGFFALAPEVHPGFYNSLYLHDRGREDAI